MIIFGPRGPQIKTRDTFFRSLMIVVVCSRKRIREILSSSLWLARSAIPTLRGRGRGVAIVEVEVHEGLKIDLVIKIKRLWNKILQFGRSHILGGQTGGVYDLGEHFLIVLLGI